MFFSKDLSASFELSSLFLWSYRFMLHSLKIKGSSPLEVLANIFAVVIHLISLCTENFNYTVNTITRVISLAFFLSLEDARMMTF